MTIPFGFTEQAREVIEKLEELTLTFRVWGVNMSGQICVEAFTKDAREEHPFTTQTFEEYQEGKITAYLPIHHKKYIEDVVLDYSLEYDEEYYIESESFLHGGFHCLGLEKSTDGLTFTIDEAASILLKQVRISCGVVPDNEWGIEWCKSAIGSTAGEIITPEDLHAIIGICIENLGQRHSMLR